MLFFTYKVQNIQRPVPAPLPTEWASASPSAPQSPPPISTPGKQQRVWRQWQTAPKLWTSGSCYDTVTIFPIFKACSDTTVAFVFFTELLSFVCNHDVFFKQPPVPLCVLPLSLGKVFLKRNILSSSKYNDAPAWSPLTSTSSNCFWLLSNSQRSSPEPILIKLSHLLSSSLSCSNGGRSWILQ